MMMKMKKTQLSITVIKLNVF